MRNISGILGGVIASCIYVCAECVRTIYSAGGRLGAGEALSAGYQRLLLGVGVIFLYSIVMQVLLARQRAAMQRMREINTRLSDGDTVKTDFLNTVSHELRTPIAIMREGVSLCMDERIGTINDMQRKLLTNSLNNIEKLNVMVSDLLKLSKAEAGKIKLLKKSFDVVPMLEAIFSDYQPQAEKKGIELSWYCKEPSISVYSDEDKIVQVINNLLNNALRFTPAGGKVSIHAANRTREVEFQVRDTGIGIKTHDQERLFSKFEQVVGTTVTGEKGTGLGLPICKGFVEKLGGTISVKSKQGKGSVFTFTIKKFEFPTVLIVDDEEDILFVIKSVLEKEHYQTITALDGMKALQLAAETRPSLILTDMILGRMNGYELIGRLKQDARTANIPLVIVSGHKLDAKKLEDIQGPCEIPLVQKPIDIQELKTVVQHSLAA